MKYFASTGLAIVAALSFEAAHPEGALNLISKAHCDYISNVPSFCRQFTHYGPGF